MIKQLSYLLLSYILIGSATLYAEIIPSETDTFDQLRVNDTGLGYPIILTVPDKTQAYPQACESLKPYVEQSASETYSKYYYVTVEFGYCTPDSTAAYHYVSGCTDVDCNYPFGPNLYGAPYGQWLNNITLKYCPSTHPIEIDTDDDGQPNYCSDEESICSCEEDFVNGQCVARTDFEYNFNNDNPEKIFTTPNNLGEYCEAPVSDEAPQPCPPDAANTPSVETENPINCASGVKRQTEVDYSSSVGGLNFRRTYSSTPISQNTLERLYAQDGQTIPDNAQVVGSHARLDKSYHQWRIEGLPVLNLDNRYPGLTIARLALPSGSELNFLKRDSETSWTAQYQKNGAIINDGTGYRYTSQSGTLYQFDAQGRLTSKTYRNGQSHSVSYPSSNHAVITDSFNRSIELFFEDIPQSLTSSSRIITKLIDPAGNEYRYQHDNAGYIIKVIYPDATPNDWTDNPYKEYLYEDRTDTKVLIGIMDENGERYATYDYDAKNRAVLSEHAGGAIKTTIDYLDATAVEQSLVRFYRDDVNYREAVYHHALLNGSDKVTKLEQLPCLGCTVGDYTYDYDANGFLSQATSPEGDITQFTYNLRGLLESRTDAFGTADQRTVTTTWHSQYKLPLTVDQPQRLTTYNYDANGNLLSRSVKDKATNETRTVSYTYNSVGQVLTVDGPRTDVSDITTYEYDTSGNLTKITNALGHETFITSHDAHGKPLSVTDPNGTVTSLTYHPRGWLTSITTDGATTSYNYDNAGQLTSVTMANGIVLNYEYDAAHRLVAIADANGNRIEYTLDNYGNRTRTEIKDTSGVIQSYAEQVFNDLGQLKQTLGANNQVNDFDYDAEGKPVQSEDALDNPTSQQFDALDRLQKVVDPALGETAFDYDNQDRLTSVTDATGKTTSYQYNAFGDLLSMTSPDTGTSTMTYDSAGNLLTVTDARNITAIYSYDALNRVTSIDYPGTAEDITFTYDDTANGNNGVGRLTQVTDESGSTAYEYDGKGQLVAEVRVINNRTFTTSYEYDASGLLLKMTYPSGREVNYYRNNLGQINLVTTTFNNTTQVVADNIGYLPFGPLKSLEYGNGKFLTQSYDQDYRLTNKSVTGLHQFNYSYTPRNNISAITDGFDSSKNQSFNYDMLARLTDANGEYGTQSYTFDSIGNRLSKNENNNYTDYSYDLNSHRLQTVGTTSFNYDAAGNVVSKAGLSFNYNAAGRLSQASKSTSMTAYYHYNANGQRVMKTVNGIKTLFHYDQAGQLIGETDFAGNVTSEYIYLDGMRIAVVTEPPAIPDPSYTTIYSDAELDTVGTTPAGWEIVDNDPAGASITTVYDNELNSNVVELVGDSAQNKFQLKNEDGSYWNNSEQFHLKWDQKTTLLNLYVTVVTNLGTKTLIYHSKDGTASLNATETQYRFYLGDSVKDNTWQTLTRDLEADMASLNPDVELIRVSFISFRGHGRLDNIQLHGNLYQEPVLHFVHTDHLGSPLALTDSNGTVQWKGSYDPYGNLTIEVNNLDQSQRLPGQRKNPETGLHYNYFRDYDPEIGRYIQSDPIGLNGGINTYGYVGANPVSFVDAYGLQKRTVYELGEGWTGHMDKFDVNGKASFEIHVKDPKGVEKGIYGPQGWINKHGLSGKPVGIPDTVENQCRGKAIMQLRKMGELPPKGQGNIKKKAGIAGALIYLSQGSAKSACDDGYEEVCSAAEQ